MRGDTLYREAVTWLAARGSDQWQYMPKCWLRLDAWASNERLHETSNLASRWRGIRIRRAPPR